MIKIPSGNRVHSHPRGSSCQIDQPFLKGGARVFTGGEEQEGGNNQQHVLPGKGHENEQHQTAVVIKFRCNPSTPNHAKPADKGGRRAVYKLFGHEFTHPDLKITNNKREKRVVRTRALVVGPVHPLVQAPTNNLRREVRRPPLHGTGGQTVTQSEDHLLQPGLQKTGNGHGVRRKGLWGCNCSQRRRMLWFAGCNNRNRSDRQKCGERGIMTDCTGRGRSGHKEPSPPWGKFVCEGSYWHPFDPRCGPVKNHLLEESRCGGRPDNVGTERMAKNLFQGPRGGRRGDATSALVTPVMGPSGDLKLTTVGATRRRKRGECVQRIMPNPEVTTFKKSFLQRSSWGGSKKI